MENKSDGRGKYRQNKIMKIIINPQPFNNLA